MSCEKGAETNNRTIGLLGNEKICRHFYLQFFSMLNIKYIFYINDEYETSLKNENLKYASLSEILMMKEKLFVVLCVEHAFRTEYDHHLFNIGLEFGKDYIDFSYIVQYFCKKNQMTLEGKNIWIFGAGKNGENFYKNYGRIYNICGFISNFEEEKVFQGFCVIRPADILNKEKVYIIICSDADVLIAKQLERLGLSGNTQYSFAELLPKKLFIGIGSCQIMKIVDVLTENKIFWAQYNVNTYFENIYEPLKDADNQRIKKYGEFCDAVFYQSVNTGLEELRNYKPIIDKFYINSIKLFIPFYYFKGQLMQATTTINPYTLKSYSGTYFWFRGDQEINSKIENNWSGDEILKEILKDDYWSKQEIIDNFKHELKRISILDRFSLFPIKEFIEKNYKHKLIFIDGTHFSYSLCLYVANEIVKKLHIEPINNIDEMNQMEGRQTSVMPVYPCVVKALEMKIEDTYQFYNIQEGTLEYLDIQEYTRRYIQYVVSVRDMYIKSGTIMAW